jgi:hypothetical protein
MTPSVRTAARLLARAASLACALALAPLGHAAAQETEETRRFCAFGRPQPSCETVLVAQFTFYPRIQRLNDLEAPYEWELGALVNRGRNQAVGATVVLGADGNGLRTAVKGRYRRWMGRYVALDASGGVAYARRDGAERSFVTEPAFGVTGDVAVGLTDWVSVGVRGDLMWSDLDREPAAATYGAVRLGTVPGVVVGVIGLALVAALADIGG